MKNLALLIAIVLTILSCNRISKETRVLSKGEDDSVIVVDVPNAGCYKCQNIIEGSLASQMGVKQSILNLHTKQVSIVYASDQVSPETLTKKVSDLIPELPCK